LSVHYVPWMEFESCCPVVRAVQDRKQTLHHPDVIARLCSGTPQQIVISLDQIWCEGMNVVLNVGFAQFLCDSVFSHSFFVCFSLSLFSHHAISFLPFPFSRFRLFFKILFSFPDRLLLWKHFSKRNVFVPTTEPVWPNNRAGLTQQQNRFLSNNRAGLTQQSRFPSRSVCSAYCSGQFIVSNSNEPTTATCLQRNEVFLVYLGLSHYLFTALCISEMHINYYCTEVM